MTTLRPLAIQLCCLAAIAAADAGLQSADPIPPPIPGAKVSTLAEAHELFGAMAARSMPIMGASEGLHGFTRFRVAAAWTDFASPGDWIWCGRVDDRTALTALLWINASTGAQLIPAVKPAGEPPELGEPAELETLLIPTAVKAAERIRGQGAAPWIEVDPPFRVGFAVAGLCQAGAWLWEARLGHQEGAVSDVVWLDAASGKSRSVAPVNAK